MVQGSSNAPEGCRKYAMRRWPKALNLTQTKAAEVLALVFNSDVEEKKAMLESEAFEDILTDARNSECKGLLSDFQDETDGDVKELSALWKTFLVKPKDAKNKSKLAEKVWPTPGEAPSADEFDRLQPPYGMTQCSATKCFTKDPLALRSHCVAGRKCGFKAKFARRDTCRSCGRNKPSVGASHATAMARSIFQSVMLRCGRRPWARSQQSEIEEKRRVVVEQPTALSARKQLEQEVAALSKLESAYQKQHKAAVGSCVLLAEEGDKVKDQKT